VAGGVLAIKPAPHRPDLAPAAGKPATVPDLSAILDTIRERPDDGPRRLALAAWL